jgi:hypothetical protein
MRTRFLLAALIACWVQAPISAGDGAPRASVAFAQAPDFLATGEAFAIAVSYELKEGLTARLNVELKDAQHNVVQAQRKEVSGKGTFEAKLTAPNTPQPILIAAWVGTDWRQSLSPIVHTEPIDVVSPDVAAKRRAAETQQKAAADAFFKPLGALPADKYAIALLKDDKLPNHDPKLADEFAELLRKDGHEVTLINADLLCNRFAVTTDRFDMLFLPACHTLPGEAGPVIKRYCDKGGDLAALGTPAFRNILTKVGDKWLSHDGWRKLLVEQPTARVLFDFESEDLAKWQRHTNAPQSPITRELAPGKEGKALHVVIPNMTGWDGFASPKLDKPFPNGHSLTCLWAKGVGETDRLMLEWREKDGSRWIATFLVGGEWQRVVLAPSDFKLWQSVKSRGGPGDCFRPENAEQLVLGVAHTHTGPRAGRYEFLIDQLGTTPAPADLASPQFLSPPILENFSPSYKFFEASGVGHMHWCSNFNLYAPRDTPRSEIFVPHPRPTGIGIGKERTWRWIPILIAYAKRHIWSIAPASAYVDFRTRSARLAIGISDAGWFSQPLPRKVLVALVHFVSSGLFIREAGTDAFTCGADGSTRFGTTVVNISRKTYEDARLRGEFNAEPTEGQGEIHWVPVRIPTKFPPGAVCSTERALTLPRSGVAGFLAVTGLDEDHDYSDFLAHEVALPKARPAANRRFVTARDGDFWLDGKKWYPHGVNYMPSTGIGVEDNEYFEYWLDAKPYDPEFVQRDLERIKEIGFNSVSIFIYHRSLPANNLLDFLRRCDELGLKVNLSLRPGTPMDYKWEEWKEIIEKNRLWEQDVIWAYDIAWEPFFGTEAERRPYDPLWREWLVKKHGSIEAAEKAWGMPAPRLDGLATGPSGQQLTRDGEHRKFVSDYRRFADELVHERYLDAYKKIKAIDPNHLISFRMTVTGDPTYNWDQNMPYDFQGVAKAMDFLAPEGYGRLGDWEKVKAGLFTVAYARMCAPDKPVFWAEAGCSVWDTEAMQPDPAKLDFQARFYRDFYRMMLESHSNGVAWWWYPGGYRVNERSDYGIINPDGTDRPVTKVIREFGPKLTAERTIPKPDVWIEIDRDADARGLFGVYERVKDQFWKAIEAGKVPGLRWK